MNKQATCGLATAIVLGLACAAIPFGVLHSSAAARQRLPDVEAWNCKACHGAEKILPEGHESTVNMAWASCAGCHGEPKTTLRGRIPGSHLHKLRGVTCSGCHEGAKEALSMEQCIACHGDPERLAQRTAHVKPENPHTSPHYGTTLDCNLCHKQHAKSENFCAQCHSFEYRVP